jgi:hypothetical protein
VKPFSLLVIASFGGGAFLFHPLGAVIYKAIIIGLCCATLFFVRHVRLNRENAVMSILLAFNMFYFFIISLSYSGSIIDAVLIIQPYIILFILFLAFAQVDFSGLRIDKISDLVAFLIILQFIMAIIKFSILGRVDEGFLIGTMSHNAGQLSFLFPAIFIPVVIFLFRKKIVLASIFVIVLFLFSILNEKRSIIYLGPIILSFSVFAVSSHRLSLKSAFAAIIFLIAAGWMALKFSSVIPSLSGSEGNIDADQGLEYLITYAIEYVFADYGGALQAAEELAAIDGNVQLGRFTLWFRILEVFQREDVFTIFFGYGGGFITPSAWVNSDDIMFDKLGFRGAVSGAGLSLLEGGLFGLLLNALLFLTLFYEINKNFKVIRSPECMRLNRILLVIFFVFLYDYLFYSIVLFRTQPMPVLFIGAYFAACFIRRYEIAKMNLSI